MIIWKWLSHIMLVRHGCYCTVDGLALKGATVNMRITEQEQEIRRKRMLYAAYELFCERGIHDVSMADIAKAANVSPNSIFRYFDSKLSLLRQTQGLLWEEIVNCITNHNKEALLNVKSGLEEMRVLLYGFENLYQNHSGYLLFAYQYKGYLLQNKIKMSQEEYGETYCKVTHYFLNSLNHGQADGSITTEYPSEILFTFIWNMMRHFVEQLVVHNRVYEGENPWESMFPLLVNQIITNLDSKKK